MKQPSPRMAGQDWLLLAILSLLWAGSFVFYKVLATELPPLTTVFGRVGIGALAMLMFLRARGIPRDVPRPMVPRFLILATLNNVIPFTLFAWAETRVTSGTAAILNAMTPVFTILIAGLVLRTETLTALRVAGVLFGFAGVAALIGAGVLLGQDIWGQAACLLAAFTYGFGVPYGRRLAGLEPSVIATGQLVASALLMLPLVLIFDSPAGPPAMSAAGWASLVGLALLSTALAYLIFFRILARAGATNLALVTFLIPISSLLMGSVFLGEPITVAALAGVALIGIGLAAIDGRAFRRLT